MPFGDKCSMRSLENITKVKIMSSPGLTGGSSGFKDFLDSGSGLPRTRYGGRNDGKRIYSGFIK